MSLKGLPPALGLLLLAPACAEYLSGYDTSTGNVTELLGGLIVFVPLYGAAALLIREGARRAGRGWPTMFLLAAAFGVLQPGLIDQAMFNPSYRDISFLAPMLEPTYIPQLGIGAYLSLHWVAGHVVFSICAPIAIVESFMRPERRTTPWLGWPGTVVTAVAFAGAAWFVVRWHLETENFVPSTGQLAGAGAVVLALVAVAFAVRTRPGPADSRPAPGPWVVGGVTFVLMSVSQVLEWTTSLVDWTGFAVYAGRLAVLAVLLVLWSRRTGWGQIHRLAAAGAALLAQAAGAFVTQPIGDVSTAAKLGHNTAFALGVVVLIIVAGKKAAGKKAELR
ncbi:hypothetical protein ACFWYW_35950 [Nonomuraea sp. NPDC059023]|uniref:hypothetical protein n=1 Tax=unclassified Nonomuraea TaxID=2593643 RepID=UPI003697DE6B